MEDIGREDADDLREFELESLTLRDWIKSSRASCFNLISNQFGRGSGGNRRNFSRQSVIDVLPQGLTTRLQGTVPAGSNSDFTANIHGMYMPQVQKLTGLCRTSQLKA
ncbi:hypothetical protein Q3G72_034352 [Acer saccharum]|nr:hypothetical protein Q3G72_034352 [Acer saccharum]